MGNKLVLNIIFLLQFWLYWMPIRVGATAKFGNLKCSADQAEYLSLEECHIQAISRNYNVINVRFKLSKTIEEIKFKLLKRERGGWHPFLYDMTLDVCDFYRRPYKFVVFNTIYSYVKKFTNVNHTCPFVVNSELQLLNWSLDEHSIIKHFPVEAGEYALHTIWYTKKKTIFQINGTVIYKE